MQYTDVHDLLVSFLHGNNFVTAGCLFWGTAYDIVLYQLQTCDLNCIKIVSDFVISANILLLSKESIHRIVMELVLYTHCTALSSRGLMFYSKMLFSFLSQLLLNYYCTNSIG